MCAIVAFGLALLVFGISALVRGQLDVRRRGSAALESKPARVIGAIWTVVGAAVLCVVSGSGTALQIARQLPDDVRFVVGIVRGLSQCIVIAGVVVFLATMLYVLFSAESQSRAGQPE